MKNKGKSLLSLVLALSLILPVVPAVTAENTAIQPVVQTFDQAEGGVILNAQTKTFQNPNLAPEETATTWSTLRAGADTSVSIVSDPNDQNKSKFARISGSNGFYYFFKSETPLSHGMYEVEGRFRTPEEAVTGWGGCLFILENNTQSTPRETISFKQKLLTYGRKSKQLYPNQWYYVRYVINMNNSTYALRCSEDREDLNKPSSLVCSGALTIKTFSALMVYKNEETHYSFDFDDIRFRELQTAEDIIFDTDGSAYTENGTFTNAQTEGFGGTPARISAKSGDKAVYEINVPESGTYSLFAWDDKKQTKMLGQAEVWHSNQADRTAVRFGGTDGFTKIGEYYFDGLGGEKLTFTVPQALGTDEQAGIACDAVLMLPGHVAISGNNAVTNLSYHYNGEQVLDPTKPVPKGKVEVSVDIEKLPYDQKGDVTLINAVVDADGVVQKVTSQSYDGQSSKLINSIEVSKDNCILRTFLWDSFAGMRPIDEMDEMPKEQINQKFDISLVEGMPLVDRITIQKGSDGFWTEGNFIDYKMAMNNQSYVYQTNEVGAAAYYKPSIRQKANVKISVYNFVEQDGVDTQVPHTGNDTDMTFEINLSGTTYTEKVDASRGKTGWVDLGVYEFSGDGREYVKLVRTNPNQNIYTKTGMMRFEIYQPTEEESGQISLPDGFSKSGTWSPLTVTSDMLAPVQPENDSLAKTTPKYGAALKSQPLITYEKGSTAGYASGKLAQGRYHVEAFLFADTDKSDTQAKYEVYANGKKQTVTIDTSSCVTGWKSLGFFEVPEGGDIKVKLIRSSTDPTRYTIADCVRFGKTRYTGSIVEYIEVLPKAYEGSVVSGQNIFVQEDSLHTTLPVGYSETGEGWSSSGLPSSSIYGPGHWTTDKNGGSTAIFNPALLENGSYTIYTYIPYRAGEPLSHHYSVISGGTENNTTVQVNPPQLQTDEWYQEYHTVGTYNFTGSGDEYLRLNCAKGKMNRVNSAVFEKTYGNGSMVYSVLVSTHPSFTQPALLDVKGENASLIREMVVRGFMEKTSENTFSPDEQITQQDFIEAISCMTNRGQNEFANGMADQTPLTGQAAKQILDSICTAMKKENTYQKAIPDIVSREDAAVLLNDFCGNILWAGPPNTGDFENAEWTKTFYDEFDGDTVDWTKWSNNDGGVPGHIRSSRWPDNSKVENGLLTLYHFKEKRVGWDYSVGGLTSTYHQKWGYFEARMKYPKAYGTHSSFWARDKNDAGEVLEIDTNEGVYPNYIAQHYFKEDGILDDTLTAHYYVPYDLSENFHNYAWYWDEEIIIFYCDGQEILRGPFIGNDVSIPVWLTAAITQYDGPKNDEFIEGAELQFDWVRIYQKN